METSSQLFDISVSSFENFARVRFCIRCVDEKQGDRVMRMLRHRMKSRRVSSCRNTQNIPRYVSHCNHLFLFPVIITRLTQRNARFGVTIANIRACSIVYLAAVLFRRRDTLPLNSPADESENRSERARLRVHWPTFLFPHRGVFPVERRSPSTAQRGG